MKKSNKFIPAIYCIMVLVITTILIALFVIHTDKNVALLYAESSAPASMGLHPKFIFFPIYPLTGVP